MLPVFLSSLRQKLCTGGRRRSEKTGKVISTLHGRAHCSNVTCAGMSFVLVNASVSVEAPRADDSESMISGVSAFPHGVNLYANMHLVHVNSSRSLIVLFIGNGLFSVSEIRHNSLNRKEDAALNFHLGFRVFLARDPRQRSSACIPISRAVLRAVLLPCGAIRRPSVRMVRYTAYGTVRCSSGLLCHDPTLLGPD